MKIADYKVYCSQVRIGWCPHNINLDPIITLFIIQVIQIDVYINGYKEANCFIVCSPLCITGNSFSSIIYIIMIVGAIIQNHQKGS